MNLTTLSTFGITATASPLGELNIIAHFSCFCQERRKGFGKFSRRTQSRKSLKEDVGRNGKGMDQKPIVMKEDSKELEKFLKAVEKKSSEKGSGRLDIDPEAAAKGKVDFVRVESWGSGVEPHTELENLRTKSFSPAVSFMDKESPFYEQLVRRLQLLDSKGDISVVHAQSLPPFERWLFGEKHYVQYLVDQHALHRALESGIANVALSTLTSNITEATKEKALPEGAAIAVGIFNKSLGLDRSEALMQDITALATGVTSADSSSFKLPAPTTQTMAYVKYLKQLSRVACDKDGGDEACLKLLAHIFSIHVAHLTTGMRVGAKAVECLPILRKSKAVNFYRNYPEQAADPLKTLIAAVNRISSFISLKTDQEKVMEELPKAMQKTSLLPSVLAVEHSISEI